MIISGNVNSELTNTELIRCIDYSKKVIDKMKRRENSEYNEKIDQLTYSKAIELIVSKKLMKLCNVDIKDIFTVYNQPSDGGYDFKVLINGTWFTVDVKCNMNINNKNLMVVTSSLCADIYILVSLDKQSKDYLIRGYISKYKLKQLNNIKPNKYNGYNYIAEPKHQSFNYEIFKGW